MEGGECRRTSEPADESLREGREVSEETITLELKQWGRSEMGTRGSAGILKG